MLPPASQNDAPNNLPLPFYPWFILFPCPVREHAAAADVSIDRFSLENQDTPYNPVTHPLIYNEGTLKHRLKQRYPLPS